MIRFSRGRRIRFELDLIMSFDVAFLNKVSAVASFTLLCLESFPDCKEKLVEQ